MRKRNRFCRSCAPDPDPAVSLLGFPEWPDLTRPYRRDLSSSSHPDTGTAPLPPLDTPKAHLSSGGPGGFQDTHKNELRSVVRLAAVEGPLQGIEVALCRRRTLVQMIAADIPLRLLDHGIRQFLQRLPGPHRVDLHLRCSLDIIKPVIGIGDALAHRADAVVGHEQYCLVTDHPGKTRPFSRIERRAGIFVILCDLARHSDLG